MSCTDDFGFALGLFWFGILFLTFGSWCGRVIRRINADCEDGARSLIVLGCDRWPLGVTRSPTGSVPFARLVRSGLPAPARAE